MVLVIKIVSKKSLGVKLMFDISIENSTKDKPSISNDVGGLLFIIRINT